MYNSVIGLFIAVGGLRAVCCLRVVSASSLLNCSFRELGYSFRSPSHLLTHFIHSFINSQPQSIPLSIHSQPLLILSHQQLSYHKQSIC